MKERKTEKYQGYETKAFFWFFFQQAGMKHVDNLKIEC